MHTPADGVRQTTGWGSERRTCKRPDASLGGVHSTDTDDGKMKPCANKPLVRIWRRCPQNVKNDRPGRLRTEIGQKTKMGDRIVSEHLHMLHTTGGQLVSEQRESSSRHLCKRAHGRRLMRHTKASSRTCAESCRRNLILRSPAASSSGQPPLAIRPPPQPQRVQLGQVV